VPGKKKRRTEERPKKSFFCQKCQRAIRMPEGWTSGPASRKHYWARHPEIMRGRRLGARGAAEGCDVCDEAAGAKLPQAR
jgi:hypothetical protein